jgi:hypothetical protein
MQSRSLEVSTRALLTTFAGDPPSGRRRLQRSFASTLHRVAAAFRVSRGGRRATVALSCRGVTPAEFDSCRVRLRLRLLLSSITSFAGDPPSDRRRLQRVIADTLHRAAAALELSRGGRRATEFAPS